MLLRLGATFRNGERMNKPSGCGIFGLVVVGALVVSFLIQNPVALIIVFFVVLAIIFVVRENNRRKQEAFVSSLEAGAKILEDLAAGKEPELSVGMALQKNEKLIFVNPSVALTEYESSGSSFSGLNAGVSFPLFGDVRGNVGGMGGNFTKNPEMLTQVDYGQAVFTNQRIIFSGAKMVRDWDLSKTVALEPGANGLNVKIAVSNRERTSGLQALSPYDFGPGFPAGFVFTLFDDGEAEAKRWALALASQIREAVAAERAKVAPKSLPSK
jgi:hypothetical protein